MKKVLFITTISGFLTQFEMNQVRILQGINYEVHYASDFDNKFYEFDESELLTEGIILHSISIKKKPNKLLSNIKAVIDIKKIIEEESIDVIHCNNPLGGVCGRIASILSNKKPLVMYTAHGFHFYKGAPLKNWLFIYPVERLLARCTDVILTINKEDYRRAHHFKIKEGGFIAQLHGMGVDINRFKPMTQLRGIVRDELHIPDDAFHIVTAGELNDNKNQRIIIDALVRCPYKNIYFSICGKGVNYDMLEKYIHKHNLTARVKLLGYRTDMERILQSADVFAFPSIREGLGIAAVEALECNIPVIASYNRGTREYVDHRYNGIMCDASNVDSFTNAIMYIYKDPKMREKMSSNARESVKRFSSVEVDHKLSKIYRKVDSMLEARS